MVTMSAKVQGVEATSSMEAGILHSTVQEVCGVNEEEEGPLQEGQALGDSRDDFDRFLGKKPTAAVTKASASDVDWTNETVPLDIDGNVETGMVPARVVHSTGCDVKFVDY